jgi:Ca2+-binding RTX toxin-like protein
VQDQVIEADETFNVSITNPTSGLTIGAGSSLTATITNDDLREIFTITKKKPVTVIGDFDSGLDLIQLEDRVFKNLLGDGPLKKKSFAANEDGEATKAVAQVIYDTDDGRLLYDRDGTGGRKAVHFATLEGSPDLSRFDFDLI